jgi:hypothetical protein
MCVCVYTVAKLFDYPNLLLYALFPQLKCWEEGGRSHSLLVHVVCVCVYTVAKLIYYPHPPKETVCVCVCVCTRWVWGGAVQNLLVRSKC